MRLFSIALVLAAGCSRLAGIGGGFVPPDAEIESNDEDANPVSVDASTAGWPTQGNVSPKPCLVAADEDGDGRADDCDNCPIDANLSQVDQDTDGIGDVCDPHPDYAIERLAYYSGFNGTLGSEGTKIGSAGTWVVQSGLLRMTSTSPSRALFMIAGGPWRHPTVEFKIAGHQYNTSSVYTTSYGGAYLLQGIPTAPEPRPDAIMCVVRWGPEPADPRMRIVRLRDGAEIAPVASISYTQAATHSGMCSATNLGEVPATAGNGGNVPLSEMPNRITLLSDPSDDELVQVGLWTYVSRVDYSGVVVYEASYP